MIITRTPFRISFAGGGSDLPAFFLSEPGCVLSTAIDKYMYLTVKERFGNTFRISYSKTEIVDKGHQIQHPIVREAVQILQIDRGLEIVSVADLPAQSGVGSSSSFTVGLLHALYAHRGQVVGPRRLAEEACRLEIEILKEPIGKQDQYAAAYGGLLFLQFLPDGQVTVEPVLVRPEVRKRLQSRLLLFFTGMTRNARDVLSKQNQTTDQNRPRLRQLCQTARDLRQILESGGDLDAFGDLMHRGWLAKKGLEASITNSQIDDYYERGRRAGALGGKLLGAGSGGFLLFYCDENHQEKLRSALADLVEVPFAFEPEGSRIIFLGGERS